MPGVELGVPFPCKGNVTTLQWIRVGSNSATEQNLGYHSGRLSAGYYLLLLKERLSPSDFHLYGTTMRSGGRAGLPGSKAGEAGRALVHDTILAERGLVGYEALQRSALNQVEITGPRRIAKVLPTIRHNDQMDPGEQYPMGGGGLQWDLRKDCTFLPALQVLADGTAHTPGFSVNLRTDGYDALARIWRYLIEA